MAHPKSPSYATLALPRSTAVRGQSIAYIKSPVRILLVALALGWVMDFLFYGNSAGISVPLFVLLLLAALFTLGRVERASLMRRNLWLLLPILFFASMVAVRANAVLTTANITTIIVLLCLLFFFYATEHVERLGMLGYPFVVAISLKQMLTKAAPEMATVARAAGPNRGYIRTAAPIVRGALIALPVLVVFTALLSSADTIFAGLLSDLFKLDFLEGMPEMLWRQALIIGAGWLIAGGLFFALGKRNETGDAPAKLPGAFNPGSLFGFVEGVVIMGLVNFLFAVFAWIQFANLFSGAAARTMHYEAYREYVRRGFGELLLVSILTMLLILGLRWMAWKETPREVRIFNTLCTIMIVLTITMLVSAFVRMVVWEGIDFYINTQLRLYIRIFIVWLGLLFGWLLFTLWLKPQRFAIGAFLVALCYLGTINVVNPDADVAAYNIARNDELSTRYLYLLSDDAVPALVAGLDTTTGRVRADLRDHLALRLERMEGGPARAQWPSFHFSRRQAYDMLSELRETGRLYPVQQIRENASRPRIW